MIDYIVGLIIIILFIFAILYVLSQKKKGKCIGCPYAKNCTKKSC